MSRLYILLGLLLFTCAVLGQPAEDGEEPAAEPVEEPADEPVEEPADEPVEEPADEPVEEPADEGEIGDEEPATAWPPNTPEGTQCTASAIEETEGLGIAMAVLEEEVHIAVYGPADKWFAAGPGGVKMEGYAIIFAPEKDPVEQDMVSKGDVGKPQAEQDLTIVSDEVKDGVRYVVVKRPRKTSDGWNDEGARTLPFTWALGEAAELKHHAARGLASLEFECIGDGPARTDGCGACELEALGVPMCVESLAEGPCLGAVRAGFEANLGPLPFKYVPGHACSLDGVVATCKLSNGLIARIHEGAMGKGMCAGGGGEWIETEVPNPECLLEIVPESEGGGPCGSCAYTLYGSDLCWDHATKKQCDDIVAWTKATLEQKDLPYDHKPNALCPTEGLVGSCEKTEPKLVMRVYGSLGEQSCQDAGDAWHEASVTIVAPECPEPTTQSGESGGDQGPTQQSIFEDCLAALPTECGTMEYSFTKDLTCPKLAECTQTLALCLTAGGATDYVKAENCDPPPGETPHCVEECKAAIESGTTKATPPVVGNTGDQSTPEITLTVSGTEAEFTDGMATKLKVAKTQIVVVSFTTTLAKMKVQGSSLVVFKVNGLTADEAAKVTTYVKDTAAAGGFASFGVPAQTVAVAEPEDEENPVEEGSGEADAGSVNKLSWLAALLMIAIIMGLP